MLLPAFVLGILLYMKKFTTRPRFNLFAKKFIKETWEASKAGLSSFIMSISIVVPNFVMQKYMSIRAQRVGEYDMIIAVYNTLFRIYGLAFFVPIALNYAYLPASSFAFGKSDFKRVLWLTFHVVWICIVWGLIITFITVCFPDQISKIWSKNDRFEYWSKQLMPRVFYTFTLLSLKFIMISYLQSTCLLYTSPSPRD